MIDEIIKTVVEEIGDVNAFAVSTQQDFNDLADSSAFPAVVFINDFTTSETLSSTGSINNTTFNITVMFTDKIGELDDTGDKIIKIQNEMAGLAREFFVRMNRLKELQDGTRLIDNRFSQSFTLDTFEHLFDTDLAGVFLEAAYSIRLPLAYCKYEC